MTPIRRSPRSGRLLTVAPDSPIGRFYASKQHEFGRWIVIWCTALVMGIGVGVIISEKVMRF